MILDLEFELSNKMFAKFKSANQTNISPIDNNPITQFFEVGKLTACAGPELVWKIHESFRKSDGKVNSNYSYFANDDMSIRKSFFMKFCFN